MIPLAFIQNIGPVQLVVTLIVIIVLFGSKKIPDIARSLGRSMGEFKKGQKEGEELARQADEEKAEKLSGDDDAKLGDK